VPEPPSAVQQVAFEDRGRLTKGPIDYAPGGSGTATGGAGQRISAPGILYSYPGKCHCSQPAQFAQVPNAAAMRLQGSTAARPARMGRWRSAEFHAPGWYGGRSRIEGNRGRSAVPSGPVELSLYV
jgi:hypothetical protein